MRDFEVGGKQRLLGDARQGCGDLLLLLRGGRANVQQIDFYLRLVRTGFGSLLRCGGKSQQEACQGQN